MKSAHRTHMATASAILLALLAAHSGCAQPLANGPSNGVSVAPAEGNFTSLLLYLSSEKAAAEDLEQRPSEYAEAKRAVEERVKAETLEESVRNMFLEPPSEYHCLKQGRHNDLTECGAARLPDLMLDPRVAKVAKIAEHGTEEERQMIHRVVTETLEEMISGEPVERVGEGRMEPGATHANGAAIYPFLLLQVDPENRSLPLLLQVSDFIQEVSRNSMPKLAAKDLQHVQHLFPGGRTPEMLPKHYSTELGAACAITMRGMLDRYCDNEAMQISLSEKQHQVIDKYRVYREVVHAGREKERTFRLENGLTETDGPWLDSRFVKAGEAIDWETGANRASKPEGKGYTRMTNPEEIVIDFVRDYVAEHQ